MQKRGEKEGIKIIINEALTRELKREEEEMRIFSNFLRRYEKMMMQ